MGDLQRAIHFSTDILIRGDGPVAAVSEAGGVRGGGGPVRNKSNIVLNVHSQNCKAA